MDKNSFFKQTALVWVIVGLVICLSFVSDRFFTTRNFLYIFQRVALMGIVATGMTIVIITAGIDLSVGSMQCLAAFIVTKLYVHAGVPLLLSVVLTFAIAVGLGWGYGSLISKTKIPAFIVTLGLMAIFRASSEIMSNTQAIPGLPYSVTWWVIGRIGGVPVITIIWLGSVAIFYFIEKKVKMGRYFYVIGGNAEAGHKAGINTRFYGILTYVFVAILASISGVLLAAKMTASVPEMGRGLELECIAAVVIGGTSLFGGRGSVIRTIQGVIFLSVINNGLVLLGFKEFGRQFFFGVVLLIVVGLANIGAAKRLLPVE